MISYDAAKELKDAGFPQKGTTPEEYIWPAGETHTTDAMCYAPTLPELIEACGKNIVGLSQMKDGKWVDWYSIGIVGFNSFMTEYSGSSPEEAVARLYIALHGSANA